jgi:FAD/FMN-containing dehydrogenase
VNAPPHALERLQAETAGLDWIVDAGRVARLSQDFHWYSPVLKPQLEGKSADIAVRPRTEDEIVALVGACARLRVPITVRGSGTGNYGQCVPLQGGVLLDMSGYAAFRWSRPGVARAQAGIRLADLEKACRDDRQELRCIPSTWRSATLGGLFGGGFGGIGSINHGPLAAPGNVLGIRALTVEPEPQAVELRGADALALHHLWGTNGIVLELEVGMAPAHDWIETIIVFEGERADTFDRSVAFCDAIARAPGIVKREVSVYAAPIPDLLQPLEAHLPKGCAAAIVAVAPASEETLLDAAGAHGGRVTYRKTAAEVEAGRRTLLEFTWNHTTLHAMRAEKSITYLQSGFVPGEHVAQMKRMEELLGDEVHLHAEFQRSMDGLPTASALQLVRFTTEERLREIVALFRANGVRINDPHTHVVEDGKAGGTIAPAAVAAKRRFDPLNLLNPGKVRAWS